MQVLLNFVGNSMKFTQSGFIKHRIQLSTSMHDCVTIMVSDTGIGIKEEDQAKLFTEFGRLDDEHGLNQNGIGLGLSICKRIVGLLGPFEYVYLQSSLGMGCSLGFYVYNREHGALQERRVLNKALVRGRLGNTEEDEAVVISSEESKPLPSIFHSRQGSACSRSALCLGDDATISLQENIRYFHFNGELGTQRTQRLRLLVVDDNPYNILVIERMLQGIEEIEIEKAFNGLEALQRVRSRHAHGLRSPDQEFNVILMDCDMPVINRFEAASILKKGKLRETPIIALSALIP